MIFLKNIDLQFLVQAYFATWYQCFDIAVFIIIVRQTLPQSVGIEISRSNVELWTLLKSIVIR